MRLKSLKTWSEGRLHLGSGLRFLFILVTWAKLSKLLEGVDSCRMSVAPLNMNGVTPNVTDFERLDISRNSWGIQEFLPTQLFNADRATTILAEIFSWIDAFVTVTPLYGQVSLRSHCDFSWIRRHSTNLTAEDYQSSKCTNSKPTSDLFISILI